METQNLFQAWCMLVMRSSLIFALLLPVQNLDAQNPPAKFERIAVAEGLSQSAVNCMLQDRQGFMWFGTGDGLNKYDGYSFTTYKHEAADSASISGNWIKSIYESRSGGSAGTLWFGTFNYGLNRFERETERFTYFLHDPNDPHSLSDNEVNVIYEDHAGTLWVGTDKGLNRFNRPASPAEKFNEIPFTRFLPDPQNPHSLSHPTITAIYEDRFNMLWIATEGGGLNWLDRDTGQFTHFVHDPNDPHSLSDDFVQEIYEDRAGRLWIGTEHGGLNKLERASSTSTVPTFTRFLYDPKNPHGLNHPDVRAICEDRSGKLWLGTLGAGLNYFDPETGQFTSRVSDPKNPSSLSNDRVSAIYQDRAGTLWIGTDDGINKLDRGQGKFMALVNALENPQNSSQNRIWSVCKDRRGALWIGTENGLFRRRWDDLAWSQTPRHVADDARRGAVRGSYDARMPLSEIKEQVFYFNHDPQNPLSLLENKIHVIYEDSRGTLWFGTASGLRLLVPNVSGEKNNAPLQFTPWEANAPNASGLDRLQIFAIIEDSSAARRSPNGENTFWIGTSGGLFRLQRDARGQYRTTVFKRDPQNPNSLSSNNVRALLVDRSGTLWVGTWADGLHQFDEPSGQFKRFIQDPKNPHSVANNFIRAIYEDRAGRLWIGTDGGLDELDRTDSPLKKFNENRGTKQFKHYTEKDGLPNNRIYCILEDDRGRLWLSTNNGISYFDPSTSASSASTSSTSASSVFKNYTVRDGLSHQEFNRGAYFKSGNGEMFFGSMNGVTVFHPDSIRDNPFVPPVVITACKRYNTDDAEGIAIVEKGISARQEIKFSYKDNIISFEFAALNFRNAEQNQYAYKLEGYREQWIQLGAHREATFTNLDPGEYVLRVKGSNDDGVWNEAGTSIKIIVTPPWWRTRWAYAVYALLVMAVFLVTDRIRRRRLIKTERERAETERKDLELKKAAELKIAYESLAEAHQNLQATQQQLVTQQKLASLGQLTAGIAHEIKNPLNFVNNFAALSVELAKELREELVKRKAKNVNGDEFADIEEILDTLEQNAEKINHHGQRADNIVKSMMQHARGSSGQREMVDVNHLLDEAVNLVYHGMRANDASFNITIEKDYDEAIGKLEVVPQDISRVFLNILNNAAYAAHQKKKDNPDGFSPVLSISTKSMGEQIEIRIRDNGNGIPLDIREKIFNPFFTTKPTGQGTGLGLSISHDIIVQEHRGEIRVETEEGKFTEFVVRLPRDASAKRK